MAGLHYINVIQQSNMVMQQRQIHYSNSQHSNRIHRDKTDIREVEKKMIRKDKERIIVTITKKEKKEIEEYCDKEKIKKSEAISRAIAVLLKKN